MFALTATATDVNPVGRYFKISTGTVKRVGKAFTEVHADGTLSYTNRRGEVRTVTAVEFDGFSYLGYTKHNAR